MEIEKLATSAIEDIISKTDYIVPYVNSSDREPSWDGYFDVYTDTSKCKKFFVGKALIQVKGKSCKKFAKREISYQVNVNDLKNYRTEGGTLFFVVQINSIGEKKIFYNALLPFDINNLLDNVGNKKSVSVKMYEFPTDKNEVANIVINFIRDKDSQMLIKNGASIKVEELIEQFGKDKIKYSFTYTGLGYDRSKPYEYLFNHDVYLYAQHTELNIKVPVDHVWRAEFFQSSLYGEIRIGENEYYDRIDIVHKKYGKEIHIGKSIVIIMDEEVPAIFKYELKGNLNERIIAENLMIDLLKTKEIFINEECLKFDISAQDNKKIDMDNMESHIKYMMDIKDVLDHLDVKEPLECTDLSSKDEDFIRMLILAFKHNKAIHFNEKNIMPIATVPIGNLNILLSFRPDKDGNYILDNYYNCRIDVCGELSDGTKFLTSKYTIFKSDDFVNISNLSEKIIVDELISIDNQGHISRTTFTLLEMIKAYDITGKSELLNEATRLAEWIYNTESTTISLINQYQCYFRMRNLSDLENDSLKKILKNETHNLQVEIAVNILLKNNIRANLLMEDLTGDERKEFVEYPIYNLLIEQNKEISI